MAFRRSSILLGVLGVVLIALAATVRPVIASWATRLPGDTDTTMKYTGTASLLDNKALAAGDVEHVLVSDVPATVNRRVHVAQTQGDKALVADDTTVYVGGTKLPSSYKYAVDRGSLQATSAPADWAGIQPAKGLTVSFPTAPRADDSYLYFDPMTQSTARVDFKGKEHVRGRDVNNYRMTVTGALKEKATLDTLPPALPKSLAVSLLPLLPPASAAQIRRNSATLPDPVPLFYTASTTIDMSVDRKSGIVIDARFRQQLTANATTAAKPTPLLPVFALDASATPASQRDLADKASSVGTQLLVLKTVTPLALLGVGLPLLTIAVLRRRRPTAAPDTVAKEPAETAAG
ncbi:porin PorA family protein [Streptomyces canus]|uniref:porin PorA family protein n=1 Tax=Streptomyces canus TaxID=58343 RepID=UPI0033D4BF29